LQPLHHKHIVSFIHHKRKNDMRVKDTRNPARKSKRQRTRLPTHLAHINRMAAGIDIGSESHFVAVPEGCADVTVKEFAAFTPDLHALADWLKACGIETIAMESTGVYWIPLYEVLESQGFDVHLVDARHVKNVSGRKTDVLDCQWLQQLHTYGLLRGAFRPTEQVHKLKIYSRQRTMLIEQAAGHIQRMQKALSQMNIKLQHVLSDITGDTGMRIIRAIVAGEHDPKVLASHRDSRCKQPQAVIEKALTGNYREEHLFSLQQALELYDTYKDKILACDEQIERQLLTFESAARSQTVHLPSPSNRRKTRSHCKNAPTFDLQSHLLRITGVDLTAIPGIEASSAFRVLAEVGWDLRPWKTGKHFASWLGLCPGNNVSGGKRLSGKSKRTANPAATILRLAASTLHQSQSALGAFFRRMKARLGAPKATTAAAHKLAIIIYNMLTRKTDYQETGQHYYEEQYRGRVLKSLQTRAKTFGYTLTKIAENSEACAVGL
jgi:transposase